MRNLLRAVLLISGALSTSPLLAQQPAEPVAAPAERLNLRIQQLPNALAGTIKYEDYFGSSFLAARPPIQLKADFVELVRRFGQPTKVLGVEPKSANSAIVKIDFELAIITAIISVEPAPPNKVVGVLLLGFDLKGDTLAKIDTDFRTLPGTAGYLIEKIGADGKRQQIAGRATGEQFAIASTFKLYVLAELASQIQAGRRSWSDVVPLVENSYSSPATQNWPRSSPVTLQTLATWMISVSDNAATDALIRVLSRDAVEEKLATIGHSDPDRALPILTTVEAFALKTNLKLRDRFEKATEAQQRDLLASEAHALKYDRIDMAQLGSGPVAVNSIEWFASPADITNLLDNIRRTGSPTALDVMAINKGIAPTNAAKWSYLGYKGGSEPGVISMSFLAQSKSGDWYAISGSWNNPEAEVDNAAFAALMGRLVDNVAN